MTTQRELGEKAARVAPFFNEYWQKYDEGEPVEEAETVFADFLADAFHLARILKLDVDHIVERAMNHFSAEVDEAEVAS